MPENDQLTLHDLNEPSLFKRGVETTREFLTDNGLPMFVIGAIALDGLLVGEKFHLFSGVLNIISHAHQSFMNGLQDAGRPH